jgi:ribA/ribD-fused uncharacterized protein
MSIRFYQEREEPYGSFSNFAKYSFEIDGMPWQTVEHYFQAMKFPGTPHEEAIRLAPAPMIAKQMGNDRAFPLRPDWEEVKDDMMRRAVRAKFQQHADIQAVLLGTGQEELIEAAPNDYYWGCGASGTGKNRLGKILMEVRESLRAQKEENA